MMVLDCSLQKYVTPLYNICDSSCPSSGQTKEKRGTQRRLSYIHMGQKSFVEGEVGIKVRLACIGERKWKDRWPKFWRCIVSKVLAVV